MSISFNPPQTNGRKHFWPLTERWVTVKWQRAVCGHQSSSSLLIDEAKRIVDHRGSVCVVVRARVWSVLVHVSFAFLPSKKLHRILDFKRSRNQRQSSESFLGKWRFPVVFLTNGVFFKCEYGGMERTTLCCESACLTTTPRQHYYATPRHKTARHATPRHGTTTTPRPLLLILSESLAEVGLEPLTIGSMRKKLTIELSWHLTHWFCRWRCENG